MTRYSAEFAATIIGVVTSIRTGSTHQWKCSPCGSAPNDRTLMTTNSTNALPSTQCFARGEAARALSTFSNRPRRILHRGGIGPSLTSSDVGAPSAGPDTAAILGAHERHR